MERFPSDYPNKRQKRADEPPPGWRGCPQFGTPIPLDPRNKENSVFIVPFKVPLGNQWSQIVGDARFTPESCIYQIQQEHGRKISYVVDLTNSRRYYYPEEFQRHGVQHIKLPCRGFGEVPDPLTVNTFVFKMLSIRRQDEPVYVGVHCTHGFNRTGFMVVHALMRFSQPTTLDIALKTYRSSRDPGIYKKRYVESLKRYYHEPRTLYVAAQTPEWKVEDAGGEDDSGEEEEEYNAHTVVYGASGENITHEMPFGEQICEEEAYVIQTDVVYFIKHQKQKYPRFPGAQPVSLARSNIDLLKEHEYFVTWKADGTRYMVLIVPQGMYFMDRSFRIQRLQMRFPRWTPEEINGRQVQKLRGHFHDFTLLDGELVVDREPSGRLTRRYLVYDIMYENGRNVMEHPFFQRYDYITHYLLNPRRKEGEEMSKPNTRYFYDYNAETVRIRRKHFWDVEQTATVLQEFSGELSHETDGLIFQAKADIYQAGTCEKILKWKCSTKNSVDFVYRQQQRGDPSNYQLFLVDRQMGNSRDNYLYPLENISLVFPEGEDPNKYDGLILECVFDGALDSWVYQRVRGDKDTPNAYRVYKNILQSIEDNITEEVLVEWLNENKIKQELKGS